jgi:ribosomal protein L7Ae-like RNA K-turn-binding protein
LNREKIKNYLGICRKAGYLIIGADNLKKYDKKMYLLLVDCDVSKTMQKIIDKFKEKNIECLMVEKLNQLVELENCKIVGVKNNGLALEIIKNIRGEEFGK